MPFRYVDFMTELMAPKEYPPQPDFAPPQLTPLRKPVSEATIGVFTSAGVRHRHQAPLGETNDLSYRLVDLATPLDDLVMDHMTPVRVWAEQDLNVAFPRDRLLELESEGAIGRVAPQAVSMVGTIARYSELMEQTVPRIHEEFARQGVDMAWLFPL